MAKEYRVYKLKYGINRYGIYLEGKIPYGYYKNETMLQLAEVILKSQKWARVGEIEEWVPTIIANEEQDADEE